MRLHDERVEGFINPPAPLQQGGKEKPGRAFQDQKAQIPRPTRQKLQPGFLLIGGALPGAFMHEGTEPLTSLRVDEFLIRALCCDTDSVAQVRVS